LGLAALVRDAHVIEKLEISKGWILVAVTAFLLYGVLRRQTRWLEREAEARGQETGEVFHAGRPKTF
jgi:hypothetical protein